MSPPPNKPLLEHDATSVTVLTSDRTMYAFLSRQRQHMIIHHLSPSLSPSPTLFPTEDKGEGDPLSYCSMGPSLNAIPPEISKHYLPLKIPSKQFYFLGGEGGGFCQFSFFLVYIRCSRMTPSLPSSDLDIARFARFSSFCFCCCLNR